MTTKSLVAAGLFALAFSGCSHIYVGDVSFTSVEVCSEELASRLHPHTGCLPPTRAENAQSYFLARYRLQLSPNEAKNIESGTPQDGGKNLLPSWLGRAFRVAVETGANGNSLVVPASGDLEFVPLDKFPERQIETEVLVQTNLSGVVQKKVKASVALDPAEIARMALGLAGLPQIQALQDVLVSQVLNAGHEKYSLNSATGSYFYVSMTPAELDSLTMALARCGWRVDVPPGRQKTTSTSVSDADVGNSIPLPAQFGNPLAECGPRPGESNAPAPNTAALLAAIKTAADGRMPYAGLVIGVAILHTEDARSEICSRTQLGLVASGTELTEPGSCLQLKRALDNFKAPPEGLVPAAFGTSSIMPGGELSKAQKATLIQALSAAYAKGTYKILDMSPHTSVLAIHWLPVRLPEGK